MPIFEAFVEEAPASRGAANTLVAASTEQAATSREAAACNVLAAVQEPDETHRLLPVALRSDQVIAELYHYFADVCVVSIFPPWEGRVRIDSNVDDDLVLAASCELNQYDGPTTESETGQVSSAIRHSLQKQAIKLHDVIKSLQEMEQSITSPLAELGLCLDHITMMQAVLNMAQFTLSKGEFVATSNAAQENNAHFEQLE